MALERFSSSSIFWRFYGATFELGIFKDWDVSGFPVHEWIAKWESGQH
jgi:hypothetical protein